jgi:hypothetical protein
MKLTPIRGNALQTPTGRLPARSVRFASTSELPTPNEPSIPPTEEPPKESRWSKAHKLGIAAKLAIVVFAPGGSLFLIVWQRKRIKRIAQGTGRLAAKGWRKVFKGTPPKTGPETY